MFAYCCGYATIVAQRQPLLVLSNHCVGCSGETSIVEPTASRDGHNLRTFGRDVSPPRIIFASSHDRTRLGKRPTGPRESRNAIRATSPHYLKCSIRAIALPRLCAPKITTPDINRIQSGSRHFCAAGTFCTRFRHDDAARDIRAISGNVFHTQDETTSCAICRGRFDRRRKPPMR